MSEESLEDFIRRPFIAEPAHAQTDFIRRPFIAEPAHAQTAPL
jgi:hypothetical protein